MDGKAPPLIYSSDPSTFLFPPPRFFSIWRICCRVCLTARRTRRKKINLYPRVFVALPPPRQCVSVISRPVWFQAFQRGRLRLPTFSPFCSSPHNAAHSPSASLLASRSLSLRPAPHLTPTQGVAQSVRMCFTLKPHYLAPVVLFNTIKRTGPS